VPQCCFTQPAVAQYFRTAARLTAKGIRSYGFHGISPMRTSSRRWRRSPPNGLALSLDAKANEIGGACISSPGGAASAWVIPTNENLMVTRQTHRLLDTVKSGRATTRAATPTSCAGDVPTLEKLAAVDLLHKLLPDLKIRVVNVVDLTTLQPRTHKALPIMISTRASQPTSR